MRVYKEKKNKRDVRRQYWEHRIDLETAKYCKGIKRQKNAKNILGMPKPRAKWIRKVISSPSWHCFPVSSIAAPSDRGSWPSIWQLSTLWRVEESKKSLDHGTKELWKSYECSKYYFMNELMYKFSIKVELVYLKSKPTYNKYYSH